MLSETSHSITVITKRNGMLGYARTVTLEFYCLSLWMMILGTEVCSQSTSPMKREVIPTNSTV